MSEAMVCRQCRRVGGVNGYWAHSTAAQKEALGNSLCPDCSEALFPKFYGNAPPKAKSNSFSDRFFSGVKRIIER